MYRLNADLHVSSCGTKYAIKHSDRQWSAGHLLTLISIQDPRKIPTDLYDKNYPVNFVSFGDFCLLYQMKHDPAQMRINANEANEWLKPNNKKSLSAKIEKLLKIRTKELEKPNRDFLIAGIVALSNKLTVRQTLALLSAKSAKRQYFEKSTFGWSITIPEHIRYTVPAVDYILDDTDLNQMCSQGFVARSNQYTYKILKHPFELPPFDLGLAIYLQQK